MKIVSVGLYNPIPIRSGVDSYISYLLNPLGKDNDVLHYYFFQSDSKKEHSSNGITFCSKYLKSKSIQNFKKLPKFLRLLRPDLLADRRTLKNISADLVICDTFTFHAGKYISKINKCPLVLIKHNVEWKYLKNDKSKVYSFLKAYEHYTMKKSDAIIAISMNDYQYFSRYVDENKIYYVPHKVNTDIFNPLGPSHKFENNKLNLLFYGSLDRPMNIGALEFIKNNLIPMLQKMQLLDRVQINVFGSGIPPRHLHLEQDKNINYLGMVEDPGVYIRGADLIIVPLKNSGGVKIRLLESLFCGKTIIATSEAADGLSDELKKMIFIENGAKGFAEIIKKFIENRNEKKIDINFLKNQMTGTTLQFVINSGSIV